MTRTFTIAEANALVPRVTEAFVRTTQLIANTRAIGRRLAARGIRPTHPGQLPDPEAVSHDPAAEADLRHAAMLTEVAMDEVRALQKLGIVVRDIERGLVDFRSVMDGEREVFLCLRIGEREVRHWHDIEAGFVGRQPIEGHRFFRSRQLAPPTD